MYFYMCTVQKEKVINKINNKTNFFQKLFKQSIYSHFKMFLLDLVYIIIEKYCR